MALPAGTQLLIFESHPIQYRAPVYQQLARLCPGRIHVVYASDFSLRGGQDPGFGRSVAWDSDLLVGYPSTVLRADLSAAPQSWGSLDGRGVPELIARLQPQAILLNSFNHRFDHVAYLCALLRRIPVWVRTETQDHAFARSWVKSVLRSVYYRLLYACIEQAFPIGQLNRKHWLNHGLKARQLRIHAHYCTVDRAGALSQQDRWSRRQQMRQQLSVTDNQLMIGFFGKLIPKKDPQLLFESLAWLPPSLRQLICLLFVGSGELGCQLEREAEIAKHTFGVPSIFPGFVNQSALVDWYLAADMVVLPSRQAGETWGLVANEALQAGCGVIVSDAVGCAADFGSWERVRTIPVASAKALALAILHIAGYPRSFTWATEELKAYSIEAAAQALAVAMDELPR